MTTKGKGLEEAEKNPDRFHAIPGLKPKRMTAHFTDAFGKSLVELAGKDARIVAITAAMESGTGLTHFKEAHPERFFDVGIAEEHALTFAAGLAASGMRPVVAIYSTFIQRALDQALHDICLQKLAVVLALDRAGLVPGDGRTHQGLYDLAFLGAMPGISILCPANAVEMRLMLDYALHLDGPAALRYPKAALPEACPYAEALSQELISGRGVFLKEVGIVCLAFCGGLMSEAQGAASLLKEAGVEAALYNIRFFKPLDRDYLREAMANYQVVVTLEDAVGEGGLGAAFSEILPSERLLCLHARPDAAQQGSSSELLEWNGLDAQGIASSVNQRLGEGGYIR
jgi:1-deoxy-D-xylulose-5-phosphate synthase